jgi:glycosyltransferase involved in cell wall biosynthesis
MVKLYKIELLHVHYAIPHAYAGYMAKQMLKDEGIIIPMVTTLHGTDITLVGNHPFYKTAVSFSINKSDIVTSVSQNLKDDTYKLFNIKKEIHVIPNFIELDKIRNESQISCHRSVMAKKEENASRILSKYFIKFKRKYQLN